MLRFVQRGAELMGSPNCIKLERLVVAEAERHPALVRTLADAVLRGVSLRGLLGGAPDTGERSEAARAAQSAVEPYLAAYAV